MNKIILDSKVYYYENSVKNFKKVMKNIKDLEDLEESLGIISWLDWTASDNKNFIYGKTKLFDLQEINKLNDLYKEKMLYIYNSIMQSFYSVCKDYATSLNDNSEPNLFPSFNIKVYNAGSSMGAHFDQLDGDKTLKYSLVMYLNDDCEGGEISFTLTDYDDMLTKTKPDVDYNIAVSNNSIDFGIKPKAGSIIIFPSSAPYHHTAHLVKNGVKYMIPAHWIHNDMKINNHE